jgi:molecular chaperone GrpE (heat shock protein)
MFEKIKQWKRNTPCDTLLLEEENETLDVFEDTQKLPDRKSVLRKVNQLYQFLADMHTRLTQQNRFLSEAISEKEKDIADMQRYFEITSECQKKTAELVNQNLERHLLYPAVLTVDILADTIRSIAQQTESLALPEQDNAPMAELIEAVRHAVRLVELKKDQLGMKEIRPHELEELDKERHQIVKAVLTEEPDRHKRICQTITSGLVYHDKILRQAKVTVYRFAKQS